MEEVNRAVDMAQCREIIDRLPDGLDTVIGTEGTYLSGGERQRIALARAFLKNAPVIVLDEATAFADPENEHLMQAALRELTRGKTVITIAHRLTSVADADEILVIDNGRIAERGTHDTLLGMKGIYYNRWNEYCRAVNWTIEKHRQPAKDGKQASTSTAERAQGTQHSGVSDMDFAAKATSSSPHASPCRRKERGTSAAAWRGLPFSTSC